MTNLTFDINKFLVAQLTANELGEDAKFNVQFVEYYIPSTNVSEINEIKQSDINWHELSDGSIHFSTTIYSLYQEIE